MGTRVIVFSYGRNCEATVKQHLDSIYSQDPVNYLHIIVNDNSTDNTEALIENHKQKYSVVYHNTDTIGFIESAFMYIPQHIKKDNNIILFVDMFEWLNDTTVIAQVTKEFGFKNYWMIYSSFNFDYGRPPLVAPPYSRGVIRKKNYRRGLFKFYGARAIKAFLFNQIDKRFMMLPNGKFPLIRYEPAFFLPFLEFIQSNKLGYIDKPLLIRSDNHPEKVISSIKHLDPQAKRIQQHFSMLKSPVEKVIVPKLLQEKPRFNPPSGTSSTELFDYLTKIWDGFNPDTLRSVLQMDKPILSVAMLSWLRTDKLISTLEHTLHTVSIPLNFCLHVQGLERLSNVNKQKILELLDQFYASEVLFTNDNLGTGIPRHDLIHFAFNKFNTPYIVTLDDDILVPKGGLEALLSILESDESLGSGSLWCSPGYRAYYLNPTTKALQQEGYRQRLGAQKITNSRIVFPDAVGSATQITRREVFETCDLDTEYKVGCGDFDFCMQMRKANWKLMMLALPELRAFNNKKGKVDPYYKTGRRHKPTLHNSKDRFRNKWKIYLN